ncbi:hypothetical protein FRC17_001528 [Serendipita sp. 399]|nr:hypothetical protein FRC17_001528 [Serendipita sp. 399]
MTDRRTGILDFRQTHLSGPYRPSLVTPGPSIALPMILKGQNFIQGTKRVAIEHEHPVKCFSLLDKLDPSALFLLTGSGERVHVFEVSDIAHGEVELLNKAEVHSLDVSYMGVWLHESQEPQNNGATLITVITSSLDGMVRKWEIHGMSLINYLLSPQVSEAAASHKPLSEHTTSILTEEEEKELAELLDGD